MPISRLLSEGAFASEEVQLITEAYEIVVDRLELKLLRSRELAAKTIIQLASGRGRFRAGDLAEAVILQLRRTG